MAIKQTETAVQPSAPTRIEAMERVTIHVNGTPVHCSKTTLKSVSPYLEANATVASLGNNPMHVSIEPEVEGAFIQYLQTGDCIFEQETLNLLTYAAYKHEMISLLKRCEQIYLHQLVPVNCLENLLFAETHGCTTLAQKAFSLALEHFEFVSKSQQFCHIGKSQLLELVGDPGLNVTSPNNVFRAIDRWIKYEANARMKDKEQICHHFSCAFSNRSLTNAAKGRIHSRDHTSACEIPAPKRRKNVTYQKQNSVNTVRGKATFYPVPMPAPTIVCVGRTEGGLEMINVTISQKQSKVVRTPVPSSIGLDKDSAFCHTFDGIHASGGYAKPDVAAFFDFETKEWSKQPKIYNGRQNHMLCHVNDRVYALGGVNSSAGRIFEYVDKFNVKAKKWSTAGKLDEVVRSAVTVPFGRDIYVFGGIRPDETHSKSVQCYNTATKKAQTVCQIPSKGFVCRGVSDRNLIYLVFSNGDVLTFNPHTHGFETLSSFPNPVVNFGSAHHNGFLYIFGGEYDQGRQRRKQSAHVHRLDLRSRGSQWELLSSLPEEVTVISCSEAIMGVG